MNKGYSSSERSVPSKLAFPALTIPPKIYKLEEKKLENVLTVT